MSASHTVRHIEIDGIGVTLAPRVLIDGRPCAAHVDPADGSVVVAMGDSFQETVANVFRAGRESARPQTPLQEASIEVVPVMQVYPLLSSGDRGPLLFDEPPADL